MSAAGAFSLFRLDGLSFSPGTDPGGEAALQGALRRMAGPAAEEVGPLRILRRSLDARRKKRPLFVYSLEVELGPEAVRALSAALGEAEFPLPEPAGKADGVPALIPAGQAPGIQPRQPAPVAVVGSGPAGLFSALRLAAAGVAVTLFERGDRVEQRVDRVSRFREGAGLDTESNIQFGEGGAGTFSDGKLYSGTSDHRRRQVLRTLVDLGAPADILYEARPHVGSDWLHGVLLNFRKTLAALGCEFRFRTRVAGLRMRQGRPSSPHRLELEGLELASGDYFPCRLAVLALGHSARDSFRMLAGAGLEVRFKPFAAGFRVEHPQELIDGIQYGSAGRVAGLPPAEYRVAVKTSAGRGVYSFCMCPGGEVVAAASGGGQSVTNGMSLRARAGRWANSGIVTGIDSGMAGCPEGDDPLAGLRWQELVERTAWDLGGAGGLAPAQRVTSFLEGRLDNDLPESSYRPGLQAARLDRCYDEKITASLREGLRLIDRRMRGFVTADALLIGVETRTSSPLRCQRDPQGRAAGILGLYPAGEGAGHAGGIISSAVDGLKIAESLLDEIASSRPA